MRGIQVEVGVLLIVGARVIYLILIQIQSLRLGIIISQQNQFGGYAKTAHKDTSQIAYKVNTIK